MLNSIFELLIKGTPAGIDSDPKHVFDGDLTTRASGTYLAQVNDEYAIYNLTTPIPVTSSVGVRIGGLRQAWEFTINKGRPDEFTAPVITGTSTAAYSFDFTGDVYSLHLKITSTDGSVFSVYGALVDGDYLVDSDVPAASAYGNNLFQTWLEWNGVVVLRDSNPEDVEKFNAIKAALVQYESERIEFQQLMVDALVAAGFTTNQIAAYIDEE